MKCTHTEVISHQFKDGSVIRKCNNPDCDYFDKDRAKVLKPNNRVVSRVTQAYIDTVLGAYSHDEEA